MWLLCTRQERFLMSNDPHGACSFGLKVVRRWMPLKADERCDLEVVIVANHIRVVNARMQGLTITPELKEEFSQFWAAHQATPFTARNKILASVCPQVRPTFPMHAALSMHASIKRGCCFLSIELTFCACKFRFEPECCCFSPNSLFILCCLLVFMCRCTDCTSSSSQC